MKNCAVLLALVMLVSSAHASSTALLPAAPTPAAGKVRVFGFTDWSLAASVVAVRGLDWASTEECLRRPSQQCHEAELPAALVKNKVGFAGYEVGISALSLLAQYEMTRHGHRKLAWLGQGIDVGFVTHTVVNNYRLDTAPLETGLRPLSTGRVLAP